MSNDSYFGVCPKCKKTDGYMNIGKSHWFYCAEHKTTWCAGDNLLSSWQHETEDEQRQQFDSIGLGSFTEVKPLHPRTVRERVNDWLLERRIRHDDIPF